MKINFNYSIGFVMISMVIISCGSNRINLPSLKETYAYKDKNPFGGFVLHHQLEQLYYHNSIRNIKDNFEKTWQNNADSTALYINISKNLFLTKADLASMLAFVYNGNSLFISSDHIDPHLLDTLGCKVIRPFFGSGIHEMKYTGVKMAIDIFNDSASYQYFYLPFYNHFSQWNKLSSTVLGSNKAGANFMVVFYGRGRFYLHTEPRALSNYFLLQKDNYKYFQQVFSFTPAIPEQVYWDDFYNKRNYAREEEGDKSDFDILLKYPATAWAFWLLLLLFGLYVFFGGKRRQRIVETIAPNINTTLAFTETIGRLYLQQKDNRNIADKLITYFLEHIRNQYYLNTSHVNDDFITTLSRKSDNTKDGTQKLFTAITTVQQSMEVSDEQLLALNQQIENFYKKNI